MNKKIYALNDLAKEIRLLDSVLGNISIQTLEKLQKLGRMIKKHKRLCEKYCNEANFNPELIKQQEDKIIGQLNEIYSNNLLKAEFQNDPRGNTCKIILSDKQIYEMLQ